MRTLNIAHDFTNTYTQILPTCNNLFFHWYSRRIDIEYICRAYVLYSKYALTSRVVAKRCRDYQYPNLSKRRRTNTREGCLVVAHLLLDYSSYAHLFDSGGETDDRIEEEGWRTIFDETILRRQTWRYWKSEEDDDIYT